MRFNDEFTKFKQTGRIEDYLSYVDKKKQREQKSINSNERMQSVKTDGDVRGNRSKPGHL